MPVLYDTKSGGNATNDLGWVASKYSERGNILVGSQRLSSHRKGDLEHTLVTTEPAPIVLPLPILILGRRVAPPPIQTSSATETLWPD